MALSEKFAEKAFDFIQHNWMKTEAGILASVGLGAIAAKLSFDKWPNEWVAYRIWLSGSLGLVVGAAVLTWWWWTNRIPRTGKGAVGILVSIACDNDHAQRAFLHDFIEILQQGLERDRTQTKFELLLVPRRRADISNTDEKAVRLLRQARAHFMVWGRVRERENAAGGVTLYMTLAARVVHADTQPEVQQALAREFSEVMPNRLETSRQARVKAFEVTSAFVELAARYIIGCAAAIGGDLTYAETVFNGVTVLIRGADQQIPAVKKIASSVPRHLLSIKRAQLFRMVAARRGLGRGPDLKTMASHAEEILRIQPKEYSALVMAAICKFEQERDVTAAKRLIKRAKKAIGRRDGTWRYSLAFLLAYEGKMDDAEKEYSQAFKSRLNDKAVPVDTEAFIQRVLDAEPEKGRLHYCVALVNRYAKDDQIACAQALRAFLDHDDSARYEAQRATARTMLSALNLQEPTTDEAREVDITLRDLPPMEDAE